MDFSQNTALLLVCDAQIYDSIYVSLTFTQFSSSQLMCRNELLLNKGR